MRMVEVTTPFLTLIFLWNQDSVRFIAPPNIGVYQLAHYQCSVDHTGVSITWYVNGTISTNNTIIQLGIITSGAGTHNSSLTIPGYPQYNNTIVQCLAAGLVNGSYYTNSSDSTMRIQGQLSDVGNLTCTRQCHFCIKCSWSPPFSLKDVPIYGYIINVTNEGDNTQYTTTDNTTSWIYCPGQFGNYTVSIAGNNSAGEGKISTTSITFATVTISTYVVAVERVISNWTITCSIENATFLEGRLSYVHAHLTPVNNATSPVDGQGSGQFKGDTFIGTVNMGDLPDKKKWLISFSLVYNSGLYINVSQPTEFTTFDVQNGSLNVTDSTVGEVCFTCHFVTGSQAEGCYVEYECFKTNFNGNVTIEKTPMGTNATKCVNGVYTCDYNVTFYDMDYNNTIYNNDYAVKLTNQSVTGLCPTPATFSLIPTPTPTSTSGVLSSTIVISSSPSPTSNSNNKKSHHLPAIIGGVLAGLFILTLIVVGIVVGIAVGVKYYRKHQQKKNAEPTNQQK